jgi:hypothetical protein
MAIYTPRGLKIRLPVNYAFALIARLYPRVDAFQVLKTTEGIESLPGAFAFLTGLVSFFLKLSLQIGITIFVVTVLLATMTRYGFYVFPSVVKLGTLYSYLAGFGILLIVLLALGFFLVGWRGVVAFVVGRLLGGLVNGVLNWHRAVYYHSVIGDAVTASEVNFINAYRLHASTLGVTTDICVSDDEMLQDNWYPAFVALTMKWPEVTARFTYD